MKKKSSKKKQIVKPISKRARSKFPALKPELNLKTRYDLLEMDKHYWDDIKKDPKAMEWLNKFNEEYVNASFKPGRKNIHKTKILKRDSYNRNNARNRCIYTREKAQGKLDFIEDLKSMMDEEVQEYENELIDAIDDRNLVSKELENFKKRSNESDDSTDT